MSFAYPAFLWLLLVVPPGMLLFFWWSRKTRQQLMTQFIQARLLPGLLAGISTTREKIRAGALIAAAVCLILALARPQWGYDLEEVKQRGLDIVVAIDTSKSMLAEDIAPNRLARAKYAALDLMQQAKSDRLGLVAFAGSAFLQCPLTIDDSAFRQSLEALDVNTLPEGGTAVADAIETAQQAFKEGDSYKVLVLFTDGEDQDSGALEAAKKAKESGLIIFPIGIGSAEGELLRIKGENGQSDYVRDASGNVVKSRLNEALLQQIAGPSPQGFYLPLKGANTIDVLYQKGLAPLPKSDSQEKWVKRARERYHWPLALAIILLIAEMLYPERKRETEPTAESRPAKGALAHAALLLVLSLLLPVTAYGSPSSALREYQSGKYDQALKDYERAIEKKSDDPRLHFNAGAAAYRGGQFDEAVKYFGQTLSSPDLNLQEQAYYNLGNTLYHLGESNSDPAKKTEHWEDSLKKYESSLKLNPQDADAKFNYEFVKKRLEELKQQQQQQQDQNKDNQNKDNQDKDKQDQKQNQKNDQAKKDQDKDSESQEQKDQNKDSEQQQQAKNQNQPKPGQDQQQQQKKDQESKQQEKKEQPQPKPPEAKNSAEQQKKDQESGEEQQAAYAGQMTPQQAKQLLDAQKNDELMLPVNRKDKENTQQRPMKDW